MIVKTLTRMVVLVCLTTLIMSQEEEECGGPLSFKPFTDILAGTEYHSRCSYPTYKLNVDCILSSCPQLSGVGPLTSNGCVNQTALEAAVSIINTCVGQDGLICGINMTRTPQVQISWTTAELIPCNMANGNVSLNPGTGYLSNLSKAKFTLPQTIDPNGKINLTINVPNVIAEVNCSCNFSIPPGSAFKNLFSSYILNFPNMHGSYYLNFTSTVTLDLSTQPPTFNTHVDQFNLTTAYTNFVNQEGVCLPEIAETFFNEGMNFFFNKSVLPSMAATFLSTYAALSLQAAQQNCL